MSNDMIQILILAAVAVFVLARLYSVLGQRRGSERPEIRPPGQPQQTGAPVRPPQAAEPYARAPAAPVPQPAPAPVPTFEGAEALMRADAGFDPQGFLGGARAAYEMIVGAFGVGNKESLRPLLTDRVYDAWAKAIDARAGTDERGPELVRLKSAEIVGATVDAGRAKVVVRFEAELADGPHGLRDAREKWTFERDTRSRDPNWFLSGVRTV